MNACARFARCAKSFGSASPSSSVVDSHPRNHVVFDTAPTGHTLRLLTLPSAWTGFVEQFARTAAEGEEALALRADLALAGISPFAWVVNQSLDPVETDDPVLSARRAAERPYVEEVRAACRRVAVVPWSPTAVRSAGSAAPVQHA